MHPGSRGRNCAKGPATHNQIYDPERILYPLKRVGKRGEGKWRRVSWDEALDDIGKNARQSGKETRRNYVSCGSTRRRPLYQSNHYGVGVDAHNSHTNICSTSSRLDTTYGQDSIARAQTTRMPTVFCSFLPPRNRALLQSTCPTHYRSQRTGRALITMDPRMSNTASKSDIWLPTWPGSDHIVAGN